MSEINWPKGLVHENKKISCCHNYHIPNWIIWDHFQKMIRFWKKKSTDPDVELEAIQRPFLWNSCTNFGETAFWSLNHAHLHRSSRFHVDNSAKSTRVYSVAYAQTTLTQCSLNRWVDVRVVSYLTLDRSLQHRTNGGGEGGGSGAVYSAQVQHGPIIACY